MENVIYEEIFKFSQSKLLYHLDQVSRYTNEHQKILILNLLNLPGENGVSFSSNTQLFNPDQNLWESIGYINSISHVIDLMNLHTSIEKDFKSIQNLVLSKSPDKLKMGNKLNIIDKFDVTHSCSPNYALQQIISLNFNLNGESIRVDGVYKNPKAQINYLFKEFISYLSFSIRSSPETSLFGRTHTVNSRSTSDLTVQTSVKKEQIIASYILACVNIIKTNTFTLEDEPHTTIKVCPLCESELVRRKSVFGYFRSCSNNSCKYTTNMKLNSKKLLSIRNGV